MSASEGMAVEADTDGAYILAAAAETKKALAPPGAEFTAFTGELIKTLQDGVAGAGETLSMEMIYTNVCAALRRNSWPQPQQRNRNNGSRISFAKNLGHRPEDRYRENSEVRERGANPVAPILLRALLERTDLDPDTASLAIQEAVEWLGQEGSSPETSFIIRALLGQNLNPGIAQRVAAIALAWLRANPDSSDAGRLAGALLTRQDLPSETAHAAAMAAIDVIGSGVDVKDVGDQPAVNRASQEPISRAPDPPTVTGVITHYGVVTGLGTINTDDGGFYLFNTRPDERHTGELYTGRTVSFVAPSADTEATVDLRMAEGDPVSVTLVLPKDAPTEVAPRPNRASGAAPAKVPDASGPEKAPHNPSPAKAGGGSGTEPTARRSPLDVGATLDFDIALRGYDKAQVQDFVRRFDNWMASPRQAPPPSRPAFTIVLRGYDRDQVDEYVQCVVLLGGVPGGHRV